MGQREVAIARGEWLYTVGRTPGGVEAFVHVAPAADGRAWRKSPLRHIVRHSPTGFEFGYGGSGPADLALSILTDYYRRTGSGEKEAVELAGRVYQGFKREFVAVADGAMAVTSGDIKTWLEVRCVQT